MLRQRIADNPTVNGILRDLIGKTWVAEPRALLLEVLLCDLGWQVQGLGYLLLLGITQDRKLHCELVSSAEFCLEVLA